MVRLEDIRLPEAGETAALMLPGQVEGTEFLGGMMRLRIDTPGRKMCVRMHRNPAREIGVGDEVRLGWATTNMVVFPDGASA
jgi:ABC-type Fe3+/spermidine/putrescine transport system ATPase subunit